MRIFHIALYNIKEVLRDYGSFSEMLLMPIVLILILGSALGGSFVVRDISPTRIAYYTTDQAMGRDILMEFFGDGGVQELLEVIPVATKDEGYQLVSTEDVWGFTYLDDNFTELYVYTNPRNSFRASIIENTLQTFVIGANTVMTQQSLGQESRGYSYETNLINESSISAKDSIPRAIDYYAVTMLVMVILYGSLYASHGMARDYLHDLGKRLKATPLRGWELFLGKIISYVALVSVQGLIVVAFTKFIYGVNWGTNIGMVILITVLVSLFSIGLGIMVCMFTRDSMLSAKVLNILIPVMTFVAGGYVRIVRPGPAFRILQHLSPNYLAQTAYFNTVYGISRGETMLLLLVLAGLSLIVFALSIVAGRRSFA